MVGNPWNCTSNLKWLLQTKGEQVADRDEMYCNDSKYQGRPLMAVMQFKKVTIFVPLYLIDMCKETIYMYMQNLRDACTSHPELKNCTCTMTYVRLMNDGHTHQPMFSINCSRLQLDHLPGFVPKNTTVFYATDNKASLVSISKSSLNTRFVCRYRIWNRYEVHIEMCMTCI